uniref:Putative salivary protein n=1 Tax=Culicoides sonorensis TaxID=179676 RepID=Q66UA0_CULSO|nr:putative salivary protein [Culicoides sonorensis]
MIFHIALVFCIVLVVCTACPHPNFVAKHVCVNCANTVADANHKAVAADQWRRQNHRPPSGQNSVFIIGHMGYTRQGNLCVFNSRVPKYDCLLRRGAWSCRFARNVIARHDAGNGHYYYRQDT